VAGRIIKNAASKNSQWSATAAAAANIVVMASAANCSMAIMTCLPTCDSGNRTAMTNSNMLIAKNLKNGKAEQSVWAITRRVALDALL
jgi:hypothetical protein